MAARYDATIPQLCIHHQGILLRPARRGPVRKDYQCHYAEMKIEEAMVYLLATSQHGMKTEQIARELELRGLVPRRNGRPLDGKVIAAIVFKHPEVFCFNEGRVRLLM